MRGVCGQALPLPRLPAHWAGRWGPPPTCCGRGCVGVGAPHCLLGLHALWGLCAAGVVGGRPRGGWPATAVRGVWCRALSLPRPPVLWGGQPGFRDPCVPGAVGAGVGTQHRPHGARPCGPVLCAVGVAIGRPRGGVPSAVVRSVSGQALPLPRLPALWAGCRGSLATCCGRPDLWSVRACGRGPLPTGCGCGGFGRGDPSPTPQRALLRAGFASCGGGMRVPGGGASCLGVGRPGSGALPPPTTLPFGRAAGAHYPLAVGSGGAGMGTRHQPHSARSCKLALRAVRAARGRPGGAPLAWPWGVRDRALSHPRPLVLLGMRPGPTTHWLWVQGVQAWGLVTNPTARAFASWLCALSGRHKGARGGRLLPGRGASGDRRSPTLDHPSFQACGRGPLPTCRGCTVWVWGPGCPWHLVPCRRSVCVVRASRVRVTRWLLWLGTCPRALVVAGGVPLWRASWPRVGAPLLVRSGRSWCSGRLSCRRGAFPHTGGCRPQLYRVAARGTWRPAENQALRACLPLFSVSVTGTSCSSAIGTVLARG